MGLSSYAFFLGNLLYSRCCRIPRLLAVNLTVTGQCNAACTYCYGNFGRGSAPDLSPAAIRRLLDEVRACGCRLVQLAGGEPLLRDDLGEILGHCRRRGMLPAVSTNGSLLPERIAELAAASGFFISLDGAEAGNDRQRGRGSYRAALLALDACRAHRRPATINAVLTRHTAGDIDHLVAVAQEYHAAVKFHFLLSARHGSAPAELEPSAAQYAAALAAIRAQLARRAPVSYSPVTYALAAAWPVPQHHTVLDERPDYPHARCFAGRFFCTIDADGSVYPCVQVLSAFTPRNAVTGGFRPAWRHAREHNSCVACNAPQFIEHNLLYAGHPQVMFRQGTRALRHWWQGEA